MGSAQPGIGEGEQFGHRLALANLFEQMLDMGDRGVRQDSMAQIEHMRSSGESPFYPPDSMVEPIAARDQGQWIEIALDRQRGG